MRDLQLALEKVSFRARDEVDVAGAPIARATASSLASALYSHVYTRRPARAKSEPPAPAKGLAEVFCDQLRRAWTGSVSGGWDFDGDSWHFFALGAGGRDRTLTRVYFHLTPQGSLRFAAALGRELGGAGCDLRAKVLRNPAEYDRADAGVLYLPTDAWPALAPALARVHEAVRPWLRDETPLFTLRLAGGLGLAEDPGGMQSFGLHRCQALAESLLDAYDAGAARDADLVARGLAQRGIAPDAPHLRPGSQQAYRLAPALEGVA